jgi:hypothetical protein
MRWRADGGAILLYGRDAQLVQTLTNLALNSIAVTSLRNLVRGAGGYGAGCGGKKMK